jgi:hypothetical protein
MLTSPSPPHTHPHAHECRQAHARSYLGLFGDVELVDPSPGQARSCHPVAPVAAHIIVHQNRLEPVCALPPVMAHVQCQVACHVLPPPVGHEPCSNPNQVSPTTTLFSPSATIVPLPFPFPLSKSQTHSYLNPPQILASSTSPLPTFFHNPLFSPSPSLSCS